MFGARRRADETEPFAALGAASARCTHLHGITADSPRQIELLSPQDLARARERHASLIQAAMPELERLHLLLGGADYIVSLSSPDIVRLICRSDTKLLGDVANYGILPGTIWSETRHGPSSLSLALQTGQAVTLSGQQHVPSWMHCLSCASAPILEQRQGCASQVAGAITVSTSRQLSCMALRQLQATVERSALRISAVMALDETGPESFASTSYRDFSSQNDRAPWPGTGMEAFIDASNAALGTSKALLIVGEAGSGKTWLLRHLLRGRRSLWLTEEMFQRDPIPELTDVDALVLDRVDLLPPSAQLRLPALIDRIRSRGGVVLASLPESKALAKLPSELRFRLGSRKVELLPLRKAPDLRKCLVRVEAGLRMELGLPPSPLTDDTLLALMQYHWPGNGHELQNLLHQALLSTEGDVLLPETLPPEILRHHRSQELRALSKFEEARIVSALMHNAGNVTRTAHYLGVSRATLYRKLALSEWREVVRADRAG